MMVTRLSEGDVAAYKKAIASGKTEAEALKVGDNGVGKWGDNTAWA